MDIFKNNLPCLIILLDLFRWRKITIISFTNQSPQVISTRQVVSLMANHTDDKSKCRRSAARNWWTRLQEWRENTYTQVHCDKSTYTRMLVVTKSHMRMHAHSCKEKRIYVGKLTFGPWRLVLGIWTYGFWTMASRQTCWSLVLSWWYWFVMVLDHCIKQGLRL